MNLSFQEKSLWVMLASLVVGFGFYFANAFGAHATLAAHAPGQSADLMAPYVGLFIAAVILLVVISVAGHVVIALRTELLEALNASDRIPRLDRPGQIQRLGDFIYTLWQDDKNKRGLWRRTSLAEFAKPDPQWELVLDLDQLGRLEGKSWVFSSANCLAPAYRRCLMQLSPVE